MSGVIEKFCAGLGVRGSQQVVVRLRMISKSQWTGMIGFTGDEIEDAVITIDKFPSILDALVEIERKIVAGELESSKGRWR